MVAQQGAALGGIVRGGSGPALGRSSFPPNCARSRPSSEHTPASDRQEALARCEEAIAAQLRAAHRTEEAKGEVLDRLRLLTARLDEAVTELLELGLEPAGGATEVSADAATGSIDTLLDDIGALHQGLREAGAAAAGATGSNPGRRRWARRGAKARRAGLPAPGVDPRATGSGPRGAEATPASSPGILMYFRRSHRRRRQPRRSMSPWE